MGDALAVGAVTVLIAVVGLAAWLRARPRRNRLSVLSKNTDARLQAFAGDLLDARAPVRPFPAAAADGALLPGPALPAVARPAPGDPAAFFGPPPSPAVQSADPDPPAPSASPAGGPRTGHQPADQTGTAYRAAVDALAAALRRAADDVLRAAGSATDPAESAARVTGAVTGAVGELPLRQVVAAAAKAAAAQADAALAAARRSDRPDDGIL